jgi:hypothetical protein
VPRLAQQLLFEPIADRRTGATHLSQHSSGRNASIRHPDPLPPSCTGFSMQSRKPRKSRPRCCLGAPHGQGQSFRCYVSAITTARNPPVSRVAIARLSPEAAGWFGNTRLSIVRQDLEAALSGSGRRAAGRHPDDNSNCQRRVGFKNTPAAGAEAAWLSRARRDVLSAS